MIEFRVLGTTGLTDAGGAEILAVLAQPKRVALLAYLAIANPHGFHRRNKLLALLWPEQDEQHARWALNQSLRYLRGALGASLVPSRGADEVRLDSAALWCDAVAFDAACEEQRWKSALELYRGDLLHGYHLSGCAEFERWLEEERARLRGRASRAAWSLADQLEADGELEGAAVWAREATVLNAHDETGVRRLIKLLDRAGDRASAVQLYEEHARWLRQELDVQPAPETSVLIASVRARTEAAKEQPFPADSTPLPERRVEDGLPEVRDGGRRPVRRRRRVPMIAIAFGLGALTLGSVWWWPLGAHVVDALSSVAGRDDADQQLKSVLLTRDLRALNLYKEGQSLLNTYTEEATRQSIYLFNEAIARDSQFAQPWVGLSRAYNHLGIAHGGLDPREAFPLMKQAAERALMLDSSLSEAHALLGEYETNFGWNWSTAERRLRDAVRLDPSSAWPLHSLAYHLTLIGRYDEIAVLDAQAIALNPLDPVVWAAAGQHQMVAGRFDDALPYLTRGLELAPRLHPMHLLIGDLYGQMGDLKQAVEHLQVADSMSGHQVLIRGVLGWAHGLAGNSAAAHEILRELKRGLAEGRSPAKSATAIANVYIGLGDRDSAFAWLDTAYRHRSANLAFVLRTHGRRLASDARYRALLDRIGLPPTAAAVRTAPQLPSTAVKRTRRRG